MPPPVNWEIATRGSTEGGSGLPARIPGQEAGWKPATTGNLAWASEKRPAVSRLQPASINRVYYARKSPAMGPLRCIERDEGSPSLRNPLNVLLLLIPLALVARLLGWPPLAIFALSGLAIVPLAKWMGTATEELAVHVGPGAGGLLNATFGNATELIIAIFALQAGLVEVVKASITGSIIGNLLVVFGLSALLGGRGREKQTFNRTAASTGTVQLTLASLGLLIPAGFFYTLHTADPARRSVLGERVSLVVAGLLILSYLLGLLFSLRTHRHLYSGEDEVAAHGAVWSVGQGVGVLLAATVGVAVMSETLVASLEDAVHVLGWSELFVGVILVPLIGNAAEHLTAVTVAIKDKMDLSLGIAVGSSTQVALFVSPFLVLISLLFSTRMDLLFSPFELIVLGLSILIVNLIALDGETNWYEGALLLISYGIIGTAFFLHD
jgi:Ca2+:H+ antiporter